MNYNDSVKSDLVDLAIARGLVTSKNAARSIQKGALIEMLEQDDLDEAREEPESEEDEADVKASEEAIEDQKRTGERSLSSAEVRADFIVCDDSMSAEQMAKNIEFKKKVRTETQTFVGVDYSNGKDHTVIVSGFKDEKGTIRIMNIETSPATAQTPRRYPHGASSMAEVRKIEKTKKKRNQKKHKRNLARRWSGYAGAQVG